MFAPGTPCCVPWVYYGAGCFVSSWHRGVGWFAPLWGLGRELARKKKNKLPQKIPIRVERWDFKFEVCCISAGNKTWETSGPSHRSLERTCPLASTTRPAWDGGLRTLSYSATSHSATLLPTAGLGSLLWRVLLKQTYFDKFCFWRSVSSDSTSHSDSCPALLSLLWQCPWGTRREKSPGSN